VSVTYLATVSAAVTLATVITVVAGVAIYRIFAAIGMRSLAAAREEQDELFQHFRGITEGIKELKLNRRRREELAGRQLDATATAYRRHSVTGLTVFEGAGGSGQAVFFVLIGVILFTFPHLLGIRGATLADSVLVLLFTVSSLQSVLTFLPALGRASVAMAKIEGRLQRLGEGPPEIASVTAPAFEGWQRITFRGVSHLYPGPKGEQFVLGPLDFEFRRGEVLFVVGANGSGKTTLAKVVTSLYPPQSGEVLVDGVLVTDANRDAYRQLFSAVFSDYFLFESLQGLPAADRAERAQEYLVRLQLDHKVSIVDQRFSTTALSQGQRKRLALLASYLEDRSFYLFDEWAADQDPLFKEFFYTELLPQLRVKNKAVMVISHDDRYFPVADRLVRLDYGQIREEQTDDEPRLAGRAAAEPAR
jgi:putative ATP-binding cassette transporter